MLEWVRPSSRKWSCAGRMQLMAVRSTFFIHYITVGKNLHDVQKG